MEEEFGIHQYGSMSESNGPPPSSPMTRARTGRAALYGPSSAAEPRAPKRPKLTTDELISGLAPKRSGFISPMNIVVPEDIPEASEDEEDEDEEDEDEEEETGDEEEEEEAEEEEARKDATPRRGGARVTRQRSGLGTTRRAATNQGRIKAQVTSTMRKSSSERLSRALGKDVGASDSELRRKAGNHKHAGDRLVDDAGQMTLEAAHEYLVAIDYYVQSATTKDMSSLTPTGDLLKWLAGKLHRARMYALAVVCYQATAQCYRSSLRSRSVDKLLAAHETAKTEIAALRAEASRNEDRHADVSYEQLGSLASLQASLGVILKAVEADNMAEGILERHPEVQTRFSRKTSLFETLGELNGMVEMGETS